MGGGGLMSGAVRKGARSEVIVTVGDEEVELLFTNRALAEAERAMGKGLWNGLQVNELRVDDVAYLIRAGLAAAQRERGRTGKPVSMEDVWRLMDAVGFQKALQIAAEAIAEVLTYEPEDDANPPE